MGRSQFQGAFAALLVVACGQVDGSVAIEIDQEREPLPQLPTPRAHGAVVVRDGRIHVIGGQHGSRFVPTSFTEVVEIPVVRPERPALLDVIGKRPATMQ
jgi:hypothetical protein